MSEQKKAIAKRFRGFLPVVVDVETGGFDASGDALLEIAAVTIKMTEAGLLALDKTVHAHIVPFPGANLERAALAFNGIDPYHPFRQAVTETQALRELFALVHGQLKAQGCSRAILVGHNATFDLSFLNAAAQRSATKRNPFHPFSCFDTVTLAGLAYGQTVLAKACVMAGIDFCTDSAHSALYDCERTALLFCTIVNRWQELSGPLLSQTPAGRKL